MESGRDGLGHDLGAKSSSHEADRVVAPESWTNTTFATQVALQVAPNSLVITNNVEPPSAAEAQGTGRPDIHDH